MPLLKSFTHAPLSYNFAVPKVSWQGVKNWVRKREVYDQDKFLGVLEVLGAIRNKEPTFLSKDVHLHLNELTLFAQGSGSRGSTLTPTYAFEPLEVPPEIR